MKNRIDTMFEQAKAQNRKTLIPFVTAGDPTIETTRKIVLEMVKQGADLVELGVPFSDPMAEGPVIQAANERALANGAHIENVMDLVVELRKDIQTPLVFLLYYNTIVAYGVDRFFARCQEVGIDGLIIPDLPFEESAEITPFTEKYNIYQIMMVAPTSEQRMAKIGHAAKGFLYCVSSLGVTGMRSEFSTDFSLFFHEIRKNCSSPCCIGFGISTPAQVRDVKQYCDGVIVGSAIVKRIADAKDEKEAIDCVGNFISELKKAIDD